MGKLIFTGPDKALKMIAKTFSKVRGVTSEHTKDEAKSEELPVPEEIIQDNTFEVSSENSEESSETIETEQDGQEFEESNEESTTTPKNKRKRK